LGRRLLLLFSKNFLSLKLRNFRLAIGSVSVCILRWRSTFNICLPRQSSGQHFTVPLCATLQFKVEHSAPVGPVTSSQTSRSPSHHGTVHCQQYYTSLLPCNCRLYPHELGHRFLGYANLVARSFDKFILLFLYNSVFSTGPHVTC